MRPVGSVLCPIIVGRDDLLDLAERRITEASAGRGQFLLLAGEAGIGKSRLLDAIRRKARAADFVAANGSLAPQDRDVPAALIGDLARSVRRMPELGTLGEDLLGMRADREADALGSRRFYVLDIVDRIAAGVDRRVLLDFEDLQWADEISLEIVGELARRARELPLLVVATYRSEDLGPGSFFREWRARLIGQRLAEEIRLAPLTRDQTALMTTLILDTGLPAPREVVDAVYERSDGIPLHVEELLGAIGDEARSDGRAIRDARVPETIEDAVLARIAQLSPEAREVARAGAVIGRCFVPEVLAGIMDRPASDLDAPLEELIGRSYLQGAGPGMFDFRHQLLRDVLYRSVPASELRRLHARAAEFGAALDGQSEIHASAHFERAGLRAQAFRAALAGARAATRMSGRREAFELYRRAIDNMPDDLPAGEQAELYDAYGEAASAIEHIRESAEATGLARERYLAAGRPIDAARMLLWLASISSREANPVDRRLELVDQAILEIGQLPASAGLEGLQRALLLARSWWRLDASRIDDGLADAALAQRLADEADDRELALDVAATQARIEIAAGQVDAGLARGLRAARDARDGGYEDVGVTAFRNLAAWATRVLDHRTAETAIREGVRYADAIEQSHCRQQMATTSALLAWAAGRWEDADEIARQELVERGCRRGMLDAMDVLGFVAMGRGRVADAHRWLDESLEGGRRTNELQMILPPLWGLAELDLGVGLPDRAAARCMEALELVVDAGERALFLPFVVTGTRAWLAARQPDQAERWLARATTHLAGWERIAGPAIAHATGLVRLAMGTVGAARDALEEAVTGWDARGRTWEASWARLDLAHCLMRSNRFGEAASLLAMVRGTAEAMGSLPLLARATELARIGRGRGASEEPWRPLTIREFEVARLIAQGMTNAEIADELQVAPKTASAHVEHILAKLGAARRAEIATWVATVAAPRDGPRGAGATVAASR